MVPYSTRMCYMLRKFEYAISLKLLNVRGGQEEPFGYMWNNIMHGKITYLHWNKGEEMAPTIAQGGTLLVRKLPIPDEMCVFPGDVVVMKDPEKSGNHLVRRLAAINAPVIKGYKMESTNEYKEQFALDNDHCWVIADNKKLKPKEANDSRKFGPVPVTNIVGRVIYCLRTSVDHGPVKNNKRSLIWDSPVLDVELDVEEMAKNHKA